MTNKMRRRNFLGRLTARGIGVVVGAGSVMSVMSVKAATRGKKLLEKRPSPPGPDPTQAQRKKHLRHANEIAKSAASKGHHPFGAVLVAPDNTTVVMEQGNINSVNHAESTLARLASERFTADELWGMTLYSTVEPCAMCAGTQYWANIGRLVYGIDESQLLQLTGASNENPTMDVPCRYIFDHSQKAIKVWGPTPELAAEIAAPHLDFWK